MDPSAASVPRFRPAVDLVTFSLNGVLPIALADAFRVDGIKARVDFLGPDFSCCERCLFCTAEELFLGEEPVNLLVNVMKMNSHIPSLLDCILIGDEKDGAGKRGDRESIGAGKRMGDKNPN